MRTLSQLRAGVIRFYNSHNIYILPAVRFVTALLLFSAINFFYGYMQSINNFFIVVILSLFCALLPFSAMSAIGIVLIVIHCFGISTEVGLFAACLYLLIFILVLRFVAKNAFAVAAAPFAFIFHVPAVVPITLGMLGKASSAFAGVCAVVSAFFLRSLPSIIQVKELGEASPLEMLKLLIEALVKNAEMWMTIIIFAAVVLVVYLIRKLCSTYGWLISILIGAAMYLVLYILGVYFLEIQTDIMPTVLGTAVSVFIALVIAFFKFNANYKGSRYLQFEDDDYYYYVKAIPKATSSNDGDYDEDEEEEYFNQDDEDAYYQSDEKGE